ncbi:peptidyl-tRNA hydrolase PTH2-domain-containing protein [Pterulicium gracile]|uniref:peptidyl-tRNA hydrolase n=1 Tax=Pterulicium gracile TaxID=1884261 RepID=A0A5C3R1H4_9AGAR|nr:peptidyl-tRNA hydrolase PTH2-domain-containing protein [Pterula gracilis]
MIYSFISACSLGFGYGLGNLSRRLCRYGAAPPPASIISRKNASTSSKPLESDSESEIEDGDLSEIKVSSSEDCELIFIVRTDLGMSLGKIAAQTSHASLACYKTLQNSNAAMLHQWEVTGRKQSTYCCSDEETLLLLQARSQSLNICARSIQDAGRTQIAAGSRTVLGIGPAPARLLEPLVEGLSFL